MFNLIATAICDLLALIIRDIVLGGIDYGIKRAYYFLRGQSYKSIKKNIVQVINESSIIGLLEF